MEEEENHHIKGLDMDEGVLNDLLECSVCLERLDTSSRVLPCQHTFCIQCLREIIYCQKELRCPECRVLVETPVDELPPNVLLMRILEGMRNSGGQRPPASPPPAQIIPRRPVIGPATFMEPVSSYGFTYSDGDGKHTNVIPKCTPHARAICDYFSKEPGDLSFKKNEVIILRRQIDTYWFHGETGGNQGAFPITFAKIIVPLPPAPPQCTALYDFHMAAHEEEGCLAFNKGAVINVIRRVDENWAEGRLHDKIGIFPIAFVEMNQSALSIINIPAPIPSNSDRIAPSTPANKAVPRSTPGTVTNKLPQQFIQKHATQRGVLLSNQVGYRQQQMSASSPVPNMGISVQRQQHMSQSHPTYCHQQHQFHRTHDSNQSATPYIDLVEVQDRSAAHLRNLPLDSQNSDSQPGIHNSKYANVSLEVRGQTSSVSQTDSNLQNVNKSRGMNTKFSNLTSGYHPTNNLSSDSSSTTTTPSFGGSSVTTTPNTSSNTSSASESNTPSSPASPATNGTQAKTNTSIANSQNMAANQAFNQNNYSNIGPLSGQIMPAPRNLPYGNAREECSGSSSTAQCDTNLDNTGNIGIKSASPSLPNPEPNIKNMQSNNSPLQNLNGNTLNITPPRSNMSSPQTCAGLQNNSFVTNSTYSQSENLQLNQNQISNKNISPSQNLVGSGGLMPHNAPSNVHGSSYSNVPSVAATSSNQTFNMCYNLNEQNKNEHLGIVSPRHGAKDSPLTSTPRTTHSHHHREKEKRNSLTPGGQIVVSHTSLNRHSAEILGPCGNLLDQDVNQESSSSKHNEKEKHRGERERQDKDGSFSIAEKFKDWDKERNRKTSGTSDRQPIPYVALYPYKPQKPDELELKKGGIYMVLEQCQDGWFKGCSSRTQKCGVFPGNYVIPASKVQISSKGRHYVTTPHSGSDDMILNSTCTKANKESSNSTNNKTKNCAEALQTSQFQIQPPDLPPRCQSPTTFNSNVSTSCPWSSPKGSSSKPEKSKEKNKVDKSSSSGVSLMKRLTGMTKSRSPPPSTHGAFSMDNPVFEDTPEIFSPSSGHDSSGQQTVSQQGVHIRSGSCPSQLLHGAPVTSVGAISNQMQTIPSHHYQNSEGHILDTAVYGTQLTVGGSVSSAVAHRLFPSHHMVKGLGSQTLGPSHGLGPIQRRQPRPTVLNALTGPPDGASLGTNHVKQQGYTIGRTSGDTPWLPASTRHHHHRKSHSLDAGQQLKSGKENTNQPINKRFRCIVAYPPNSEYELELQVDDVVLVHKQWGEGWYKGTLERTGHTGLVPASFVEAC